MSGYQRYTLSLAATVQNIVTSPRNPSRSRAFARRLKPLTRVFDCAPVLISKPAQARIRRSIFTSGSFSSVSGSSSPGLSPWVHLGEFIWYVHCLATSIHQVYSRSCKFSPSCVLYSRSCTLNSSCIFTGMLIQSVVCVIFTVVHAQFTLHSYGPQLRFQGARNHPNK